MEMMIKNHWRLFVITFFVFLILFSCSYAIYNESVKIGVSTVTGNFICDVIVDSNENYVENNEAYFLVSVNNFKVDGKRVVLTSTDINYSLTIENKNGSNGYFRFVDEDGNTNGTPTNIVTISNQSLGKEKATKKYKVYVTTDSNLKENVSFVVKLDAKQKNMEQR